jgi:hypothetical protein
MIKQQIYVFHMISESLMINDLLRKMIWIVNNPLLT